MSHPSLLHHIYALGEQIIETLNRIPDDPDADEALVELIQDREVLLEQLDAHAHPEEISDEWQQLSVKLSKQQEDLQEAINGAEQRYLTRLGEMDRTHQAHVSYQNRHGPEPRTILSSELRV